MKCKILLSCLLVFVSATAIAQKQAVIDTIQIKGLVIVKGKTAEGKSVFRAYQDTGYARQKLKKNLHTKWLVFDVGFNNYRDKSNYGDALVMSLHPPRLPASSARTTQVPHTITKASTIPAPPSIASRPAWPASRLPFRNSN